MTAKPEIICESVGSRRQSYFEIINKKSSKCVFPWCDYGKYWRGWRKNPKEPQQSEHIQHLCLNHSKSKVNYNYALNASSIIKDVQLAEQKRKYEELSSEIVLKDQEITELKRLYIELIDKFKSNDSDINILKCNEGSLYAQIKAKDAIINSQEQTIAGEKRKYQELIDTVEPKDIQISELNEKIKKIEQQNVELSEDREQIIFNKTAEIVNQRNRIDQLNTLKEKTIHSIVYLNGKLNEKDVQITNYKKDLSDLHDKLKAKSTECDIKTIDLRHAASYINDLKRLIEQQNTQIAIYSNTKHLEITKLKEENESLKKQINWLQLQIVTNEVDQPEEGAEPPRKKRRV